MPNCDVNVYNGSEDTPAAGGGDLILAHRLAGIIHRQVEKRRNSFAASSWRETPEMQCVNQPERASVRFPACLTRTGR